MTLKCCVNEAAEGFTGSQEGVVPVEVEGKLLVEVSPVQ